MTLKVCVIFEMIGFVRNTLTRKGERRRMGKDGGMEGGREGGTEVWNLYDRGYWLW